MEGVNYLPDEDNFLPNDIPHLHSLLTAIQLTIFSNGQHKIWRMTRGVKYELKYPWERRIIPTR